MKVFAVDGKFLNEILGNELINSNEKQKEVVLCESHSKVINLVEYVKLDYNESIENAKEFKYLISVDICINAGSACSVSSQSLTTFCRQRYTNLGVRVLQQGQSDSITKSVVIPQSCECRFIHPLEIITDSEYLQTPTISSSSEAHNIINSLKSEHLNADDKQQSNIEIST